MINLKQKILNGITNREYKKGYSDDVYYLNIKLGWFRKAQIMIFKKDREPYDWYCSHSIKIGNHHVIIPIELMSLEDIKEVGKTFSSAVVEDRQISLNKSLELDKKLIRRFFR